MNGLRRALRRAFTLVEMLTVIAIIGILAGILIPTVMMVMGKAKVSAAHADIRTLMTALTQYNLDFGAFPPDLPACLQAPGVTFPGTLNPNQCMTWFLSRTYSTGDITQGVLGQPWNGLWTPASAGTVFARGNFGPYFTPRGRQLKDIGADGYPEFVDPWGRPYMYRAYPPPPAQWPGVSVTSVYVDGKTAELTLSTIVGGGLGSTVGSIQLNFPGAPACNGAYPFVGVGDNVVKVTFAAAPVNGTNGTYCFPLHNPQSCDLYSLGPNGTTRATHEPSSPSGEWHPVDAATLAYWTQIWGTPGDGYDTDSGNILINTKAQDDVNNW